MHENIWRRLHGHVCGTDFDVYLHTHMHHGFFFSLLVNINWSFSGEQTPGFALWTGRFRNVVPVGVSWRAGARATMLADLCLCLCVSVYGPNCTDVCSCC